jgi:hypothetical protein
VEVERTGWRSGNRDQVRASAEPTILIDGARDAPDAGGAVGPMPRALTGRLRGDVRLE